MQIMKNLAAYVVRKIEYLREFNVDIDLCGMSLKVRIVNGDP